MEVRGCDIGVNLVLERCPTYGQSLSNIFQPPSLMNLSLRGKVPSRWNFCTAAHANSSLEKTTPQSTHTGLAPPAFKFTRSTRVTNMRLLRQDLRERHVNPGLRARCSYPVPSLAMQSVNPVGTIDKDRWSPVSQRGWMAGSQ